MIKIYITSESAEAAMNELKAWIGNTSTKVEKVPQSESNTAKRKRGTSRLGWKKWTSSEDERLKTYMDMGYSSHELDGSFPGRSTDAITNRMIVLKKRSKLQK